MDKDLVVRAQHGDAAAFAVLADHVYGRLQQVALRILRDRELAKDAAQQAALDMWRNLPQLRDPERFEAWAYRILVNHCRREGRRTSRKMLAVLPTPRADDMDVVLDRDQLERGFRRLSIDHRTVLVLHHYADMPVEMIAATLGLPVGTVQSRMHRALAHMRTALGADIEPLSTVPQEASR